MNKYENLDDGYTDDSRVCSECGEAVWYDERCECEANDVERSDYEESMRNDEYDERNDR